MRSYWFILFGSVAISFALCTPAIWRYRKELARGFKETWGVAVDNDVVMQERMDALRNAEPVGWLAQVELTVMALAAIIAFSTGAYYGGVIVVACFVLAFALVVMFNVVLLGALPLLPDRTDPLLSRGRSELRPSRGMSDQSLTTRPPQVVVRVRNVLLTPGDCRPGRASSRRSDPSARPRGSWRTWAGRTWFVGKTLAQRRLAGQKPHQFRRVGQADLASPWPLLGTGRILVRVRCVLSSGGLFVPSIVPSI